MHNFSKRLLLVMGLGCAAFGFSASGCLSSVALGVSAAFALAGVVGPSTLQLKYTREEHL